MKITVLEVNFKERSPISCVHGPMACGWAAKWVVPKTRVSPSMGHNLGQTWWNGMNFGGGDAYRSKEHLHKYRVLIPLFDGFQAKITGFRWSNPRVTATPKNNSPKTKNYWELPPGEVAGKASIRWDLKSQAERCMYTQDTAPTARSLKRLVARGTRRCRGPPVELPVLLHHPVRATDQWQQLETMNGFGH